MDETEDEKEDEEEEEEEEEDLGRRGPFIDFCPGDWQLLLDSHYCLKTSF